MKSAKLFFSLATLGVLLIGSGNSAQAVSKNADLAVSASISGNCTISTIAVGFPAYDPIVTHASAADDSTSGSVTIACTKNTSATIGLGQGGSYLGGTNRMTDGTNFLTYALYQNSTHATAWTTSGVGLMSVVPTSKAPVSYTVYGSIPGNQDLPAGTYNDTVVASVNF